ncbi:MAG: family 16 glycoside hydrolase, partial [Pirellulales bacterium]
MVWVGALELLLGAASVTAAEEQSLFNGKDLSGWRGDPAVWTVEGDAILGSTTKANPVKHNTFLIYEKPFADFELTLKYKIIGGNSGVQYRSKVIDEAKFIVGGYQADFEAGTTYSGILYEERGRGILAQRGQQVVIQANGQRKAQQVADTNALQQKIRHEDWNDYRVVASGERLQHYINGQLTADVTDKQPGKRAASGVIAFQVHAGPPMKVYFKDIVAKPIAVSDKLAGKNGEAPNFAADRAPMWIWAADGGDACQLQKQFPGGAKSAHLLATCDNNMVIYLNGKKVAASSDWKLPVTADVSKWLVAGNNQIRVDAGDAGGEMGFVMKLMLTMPDGTRKYVVTDNTWQGSANKDAKAAPVKVFGEMGARPWGNVFATAPVPASLAVPQTLTLSPMFRDSAVLQRDRDVPVWGWAEPGAEVTVEFADQSVKTTTDDDGAWILNLKPLKVNKEPQQMTVMAGGTTVTLGDILVGDVWFCSGQSNMEWIVGQSLVPEFVDPKKLGVIRHFKFPHVTKGPTPIRSNGNAGPWQVCNSTTVGHFTAVGFYFAYTLNKELDIPVGLIGCNWGGCRIEPWIPPAGLELVKEQNPEKWPQKSVMYHGMATIAIPYAIKGSLWYQGESNGGEGEEYFWKTKALHEGWQKVWGQGKFPFYFAQLASFEQPNPNP